MPTRATWILGSEAVRRALPSFSVMEIMPVSAMAKLAPLMPMSAWQYFKRRAWRAIMVNSSGIVGGRGTKLVMEQIADLMTGQVHGGEDQMIGGFVTELDNVFAEVGFNDLEAVLFQGVVEMDFLGGHALGLDDQPGLAVAGQLNDVVARRGGVRRPKNFRAAGLELGGEFIKITIQMIDRVPFDGGGGLAGVRPTAKAVFELVALEIIAGQGGLDEMTMAQIGGVMPGLLAEFNGGVAHGVFFRAVWKPISGRGGSGGTRSRRILS